MKKILSTMAAILTAFVLSVPSFATEAVETAVNEADAVSDTTVVFVFFGIVVALLITIAIFTVARTLSYIVKKLKK